MNVDLIGRIANTKLNPVNCLNPLFEAIVNSIHAIEDAKEKNGKIRIHIKRDGVQRAIEAEGSLVGLNPIESFIIEDNGIGFTDENFSAFKTCDTTKKAARGGKGVGRFLWLKAFTRAEIESTYIHNDALWRRAFGFTLTKAGVVHECAEKALSAERKTVVTLVGFKPDFQRKCPKTATAIARQIVEHCLEYFVLDTCPSIHLIDTDADDQIDLMRMFSREIKVEASSRNVKIKNQRLRIINMLISSSTDDKHRLYFCAHKRAVRP
ncbi:MAG: ATP-binding protein [Isosphaeraceae bacterium]